jgi:hypothetical protein
VCDYFDVVEHPKILYLAREDSGERIQARIADIVKQWPEALVPGALRIIVRPKGFNMGTPEHMAWVRAQCREHGYTMLVFDTWTALSPGYDPMGAKEQTMLAQAVAGLTEDFGGCTVVVDHTRKNAGEGALSSAEILGPSQKWQNAETILIFADTSTPGRIEVFAEGKDLDEARFFLVVSPRGSIDPGVEKFTYAGSVEQAADASRLKGGKNCRKVLDAIVAKGSGLTLQQVMDQTNLGRSTVLSHVATLKAAKLVLDDALGHGYIPVVQGSEGEGVQGPSRTHSDSQTACSTPQPTPEAGRGVQGVLPHIETQK